MGGYDIRLSYWTLHFRWTVECGILLGNVGDMAHNSSERQRTLDDVWLQHDVATAHFALCVRDILNERFPGRWIRRGSPTSPAPLSWPPRSPDLTTPHQTIRCGVLSREEWLRVATTTKICTKLWKTPFAQLLQKCSDVCQRGYEGASVCVSSIKVHIMIRWTCNQGVLSDSNEIMVAYLSVYGDFSATLYINSINKQ